MKMIIVEDAESGRSISIRIDVDDMSMAKLKQQLALFVSVPPQDQIILIGPPFKLLETLFGPGFSQREDQRIFLYNRLIFSSSEDNYKRHVTEVRLQPYSIPEPESIDVPKEISQVYGKSSTSPLVKAILDYQHQFLRNLKRAEAYLKACEGCNISVIKCSEEQLVQRDSLHAALSHFKDDFSSVNSRFEQTKEKILTQQNHHGEILSAFDNDLENLRSVTIASSFHKFMRRDRTSSGEQPLTKILDGSIAEVHIPSVSSSHHDMNMNMSTTTSYREEATINDTLLKSQTIDQYNRPTHLQLVNVVTNESYTLYDCIPVEKERAWANQCRAVHSKVEDTLVDLQSAYDHIIALVKKLDDPTIKFDVVLATKNQISEYLQQQHAYIEQLREDYQTIYNIVIRRLDPAFDVASENNVATLSMLETKWKTQEIHLENMEKITNIVMGLKNEIAASKIEMTKHLFNRITLIAVIQTDIQKMMERLFQMKKWYKGRNEFFTHLEHVSRLPTAYEFFLREIIRRQYYHEMLKSKVSLFTNSLNRYREEETSYRKEFMLKWGKYLTPTFFDIVPSLAEKPPYFSLTGSDIPILPVVTEDDIKIKIIRSSVTDQEDLSLIGKNNVAGMEREKLFKDNEPSKQVDDSSVMFEPTALLSVTPSDAVMTVDKFHEIQYENALLRAKIAELTKQLSNVSTTNSSGQAIISDNITTVVSHNDNIGEVVTKPAQPLSETVSETTSVNIQQQQQQEKEEKEKEEEEREKSKQQDEKRFQELEELVYVLSDGLMTMKSSFINEIMQRSADVTESTTVIDDVMSSSSASANMLDTSSAKKLVDKSVKLMNHFKILTKNKFTKEIQDMNYKIQSLEDELESKSRLEDVKETVVSSILNETIPTLAATSTSLSTTISSLSREALHHIPSPENIFISVTNFVENSIALFIYRSSTTYIAFHVNCPHRYMSEESISSIKQSKNKSPDFIIGRVILYERKVASSEANPFDLAVGTEYYLLTVEDLTSPLQKSQSARAHKSRKDSLSFESNSGTPKQDKHDSTL